MLLKTSSNVVLSPTFPDTTKRDLMISAATALSSTGSTTPSSAAATARRQISCSCGASPQFIRKPINSDLKELRRAFSDSQLDQYLLPSSHSTSSSCCGTPTCYRSATAAAAENQFTFHFPGFPEIPTGSNTDATPSLSIYSATTDEEGETNLVVVEGLSGLVRTVTIGDKIEDVILDLISVGQSSMGSIVEEEGEGEPEEEEVHDQDEDDQGFKLDDQPPPRMNSPPMYLATGLGSDVIAASDLIANREDLEEYYRSIVGQFPSNPVVFRNYAQLLKNKGDLHGAKDYYLRATAADPEDGDILAQYAVLVWELHGDRDIVEEYFKRAIQASPQDSKVLAAHASFLWEVDDNSGGQIESSRKDCLSSKGSNWTQRSDEEQVQKRTLNHLENSVAVGCGGFAGFGGGNTGIDLVTGGPGGGSSLEEYYKRMVAENPFSPLVLRNYAHFLYQSKGDLQGAEEYYSRALLMDQSDGDLLSQYANLSWELHGDKNKAQSYFERSVKTAPADSHVLAAYASFLWNTGGEEKEADDEEMQGIPQLPCVQMPIPMPRGILAAQGA